MNFIRSLWNKIKAFFSNLFGKKAEQAQQEEKQTPPAEVKVFDSALAFEAAYDKAEEIAYDPQWANGTGYYDHAAEGAFAPKLNVGQIVKAKSPYPNNRKIIIVGTDLGNVVVFERYTAGAHGVYVWNATDAYAHAHGDKLDRPLTAGNMKFIFDQAAVAA